jgi:GxxExxY protein
MKESRDDDPQTYAIIAAAMNVHRIPGCGFLEPVYQEALAIEFEMSGIPFVSQAAFQIVYKSRTLTSGYRVDFLCFETIIVELKALARLSSVELKALARLSSIEEAQSINYMKVAKCKTGLLLNFGAMRLEYKRLILSSFSSASSASSADN